MNPNEIRFSQASVKYYIRDGSSIDDLAEALRSGRVRPEEVPAIRLVEKDGLLYTLDNRRLEAFRRAGVEITTRMATAEEIAEEQWKFTTTNAGVSVRVRGQPS